MSDYIKIEVDREVYDYLQSEAVPFTDTPNAVLRRLLLKDNAPNKIIKPEGHQVLRSDNSKAFVSFVLKRDFAEQLHKRSPYKMMFESDKHLIYFQNFNKENDRLWYRVTSKPYEILRSSRKITFLILTNPAERIAYIIPFEEVKNRCHVSKWTRDYLEINIDHMSSRWIELNWNIKEYLKRYKN